MVASVVDVVSTVLFAAGLGGLVLAALVRVVALGKVAETTSGEQATGSSEREDER